MDEVSANGCRQLVALLEARGLPRSELLRDLRLDAEDLRRPRGRIPWSDFVAILERAAERLGGPEAMEDVGAQHTARPVFGWFPAMARAAISPRDLYWLGKCYGHSVFRNVPCKHEVLSSSRIRQTLTIPPEHRDCPAFFHLMRGVLRSTTCLIGLPEARVSMELVPRRAVYTVTLPRSMSLPARLLRKLRFSRFALREVLDEFTLQHEELIEKCQQLTEANAHILEQAEKRRKAEEELHQAQRLEAVGRLASGIAHDFNNILTTITVYTDLASAHVHDAAAVEKDLERIRRATEQAARVTRQLLDFSRSQPVWPAVLDLDERVSNLRDVLTRLIADSIDLETRLDSTGARVRMDPTQLDQVILNLVLNARDALLDGGRIMISTSVVSVDADGPAEEPALGPGRYACVSVRDNGCGMDEATRSRVFEPFFTTKGVGAGTGLGLSIVHGIAGQNGGKAIISSEPGAGTTVRVYLPVTDEAPETSAATNPRDDPRPRPATVLLVDDEDELRDAMGRMLRQAGCSVLEASDGSHASRILAHGSGGIDVLVTDVRMPGLSGWELARLLRCQGLELPILYISGWAEDAGSRRLGPGEAFLAKPFSADRLVDEVQSLLDAGIATARPRAAPDA